MTQMETRHYFAGTHQEIDTCSEAFKSGYLCGLDNEESTGWQIEDVPTEATLVDFLYHVAQLVPAGNFDAHELAWVAGLLAGWIARSQNTRM